MDVSCGSYFDLGSRVGPVWWNLGGLAPRFDRGVHLNHGVLYRAARPSRFLRHAHPIFARLDVRFVADVEPWMHYPCCERGRRLREQCSRRMEGTAGIG